MGDSWPAGGSDGTARISKKIDTTRRDRSID